MVTSPAQTSKRRRQERPKRPARNRGRPGSAAELKAFRRRPVGELVLEVPAMRWLLAFALLLVAAAGCAPATPPRQGQGAAPPGLAEVRHRLPLRPLPPPAPLQLCALAGEPAVRAEVTGPYSQSVIATGGVLPVLADTGELWVRFHLPSGTLREEAGRPLQRPVLQVWLPPGCGRRPG